MIKKTGVGPGPGTAFVFSGAGTPFRSDELTADDAAGGRTGEVSDVPRWLPDTGTGYTVSENRAADGLELHRPLVCNRRSLDPSNQERSVRDDQGRVPARR